MKAFSAIKRQSDIAFEYAAASYKILRLSYYNSLQVQVGELTVLIFKFGNKMVCKNLNVSVSAGIHCPTFNDDSTSSFSHFEF